MQRLLHGLAIALGAGCAVAALAAEPPKPVSKTQPAKSAAPQSVKAPGTTNVKGTVAPVKPAPTTVAPVKNDPHHVPPAATPQPAPQAAPEIKPETKPEAKKAAEPPPAQWSQAEITLAKARCAALLKTVDAVTMPEAPIRNSACGAPAPVRLVSIGKSPEVALDPPPLLTCDMVAALGTWLKNDLQPLSKKHLGNAIIKIETMSDYSCRAAYGRTGNKLSEHGHANALDIRGFVTAKGQLAYVLEEWGKTRRDIAREIAAAKAAAEKAEQERAAAAAPTKAATPQQAAAPVAAKPAGATPSKVEQLATGAAEAVRGMVKSTISNGTPKPAAPQSGHALAPDHLGGPKDSAALPAPAETAVAVSKKGRFLREAHDAACRIFGTTLGPEANEAHRNHLHVDMAERKSGGFCE